MNLQLLISVPLSECGNFSFTHYLIMYIFCLVFIIFIFELFYFYVPLQVYLNSDYVTYYDISFNYCCFFLCNFHICFNDFFFCDLIFSLSFVCDFVPPAECINFNFSHNLFTHFFYFVLITYIFKLFNFYVSLKVYINSNCVTCFAISFKYCYFLFYNFYICFRFYIITLINYYIESSTYYVTSFNQYANSFDCDFYFYNLILSLFFIFDFVPPTECVNFDSRHDLHIFCLMFMICIFKLFNFYVSLRVYLNSDYVTYAISFNYCSFFLYNIYICFHFINCYVMPSSYYVTSFNQYANSFDCDFFFYNLIFSYMILNSILYNAYLCTKLYNFYFILIFNG